MQVDRQSRSNLIWLAINGLLLIGALVLMAVDGPSLVRWLIVTTLLANFMVHFLLLRSRSRTSDPGADSQKRGAGS